MEISSQNGDGFNTLYRWLWLWTIFVLFFLFFSFQNFLFEGPWDSLETKRCILMVQPFIIYIYIQIQTMYRSCNRPYESDFHCCSCMVNFLFYVTCVRIASLDSHILHSPLLIISGFTVTVATSMIKWPKYQDMILVASHISRLLWWFTTPKPLWWSEIKWRDARVRGLSTVPLSC